MLYPSTPFFIVLLSLCSLLQNIAISKGYFGFKLLGPYTFSTLNATSKKKRLLHGIKYAVCALVSNNFFTSICRNIYPQ